MKRHDHTKGRKIGTGTSRDKRLTDTIQGKDLGKRNEVSNMKINRKEKDPNVTKFGMLTRGSVFRRNTPKPEHSNVYMKFDEGCQSYAVDLSDGLFVTFDSYDCVVPLKAELTIEE